MRHCWNDSLAVRTDLRAFMESHRAAIKKGQESGAFFHFLLNKMS